jgi:ATP sulfurylase
MAKIGLIAMSAKPYHAGHDGLVRLAAGECDKVLLFVSTTDRDIVSGEAMRKCWDELIKPSLPSNVEVTFTDGGSPVGHVWKVLGSANEANSDDAHAIYADPEDLATNFPNNRIHKYAGNLLQRGKIVQRPISRSDTVDTSGTEMRQHLRKGDKASFLKSAPRTFDQDAYWATLSASALLGELVSETVKARKRSKRART